MTTGQSIGRWTANAINRSGRQIAVANARIPDPKDSTGNRHKGQEENDAKRNMVAH